MTECQESRRRPNEALQLTKREYIVGRPASRASVIESRFAAERRCSADRRETGPTTVHRLGAARA